MIMENTASSCSLVDQQVNTFRFVSHAVNGASSHSLVIEFVPLAIHLDVSVVVAAVETAQMMDNAHQLILYR